MPMMRRKQTIRAHFRPTSTRVRWPEQESTAFNKDPTRYQTPVHPDSIEPFFSSHTSAQTPSRTATSKLACRPVARERPDSAASPSKSQSIDCNFLDDNDLTARRQSAWDNHNLGNLTHPCKGSMAGLSHLSQRRHHPPHHPHRPHRAPPDSYQTFRIHSLRPRPRRACILQTIASGTRDREEEKLSEAADVRREAGKTRTAK